MRAPALIGFVILAATVSGCGHPYTQVYLANLDDVQYCVSFVDSFGDRTEAIVGAHAAGGLFTAPGEVSGTVELRRPEQAVTQRLDITAGKANLVEIEGGSLRLNDHADLSSRGAGDFESAPGCAAPTPPPPAGTLGPG